MYEIHCIQMNGWEEVMRGETDNRKVSLTKNSISAGIRLTSNRKKWEKKAFT